MLFTEAATILVISRFVIDVSLLSFTGLILWFMNMTNNGQMDRDNENPT